MKNMNFFLGIIVVISFALDTLSSDTQENLFTNSFQDMHLSAPQETLFCFERQDLYWEISSLEKWQEMNPYYAKASVL